MKTLTVLKLTVGLLAGEAMRRRRAQDRSETTEAASPAAESDLKEAA